MLDGVQKVRLTPLLVYASHFAIFLQSQNMFAHVIINRKLPEKLNSLIYTIPPSLANHIQVGSIVSVPLRNSLIHGIVIKKTHSKDIAIKNIKDIEAIQPLSSLNKKQLQSIHEISSYYCCTLSSVVKFFLPPVPKRLIKPLGEYEKPSIHENQKEIFEKQKRYLFKYTFEREKYHFYKQCIDQVISGGGQILFIFAELFQLQAFEQELIPNTFVSLKGSTRSTQYYRAWDAIAQKKVSIITGTRKAWLAPFSSLQLIIVDDEHNSSHKNWDMHPRMHNRDVGYLLANIHKSALILSSFAPSCESFLQVMRKELQLIHPNSKQHFHKFTLVNLADEGKWGHYAFLSQATQQSIERNMAQGTQTLLLLNKKSEYGSVVCAHCKVHALCATCKLPLRGSLAQERERKNAFCLRCRQEVPFPSFCMNCQKTSFRLVGISMTRLSQELKKRFPHATVLPMHAESRSLTRAKKMQKHTKKDTSIPTELEKAHILIATDIAFSQLHWKKISTIALVLADLELSLPYFRAGEELLQTLLQIRNKAEHESECLSEVIIQTFHPEHEIFSYAASNELKHFYRKELITRKMLGYPPFQQFVLCTYKNKSKTIGSKAVQETLKRFRIFMQKYDGVAVVGDADLAPKKNGTIFEWRVLIKKQKHTVLPLQTFFTDSWVIDVDPIQLL